jgi:hypothetical protein
MKTIENKTNEELIVVDEATSISDSWNGCPVCGMDEWCGTDGCPMDPQ